MEEKPNYFAIIPATVRYDNNLKANEKLLYGEITALCNKEGFCWATNKYFADLYDVENETISRWITNLINNNYLDVQYQNDNRRLLIIKSIPIDQKINTLLIKKSNIIIKDNNTYNNKEENNIKEESIFDYYQQEIGQLSPNQYELINSYIDKYGEDKIKEAINTSCNNNVKTFNYFSSVLTNGNYKKSKNSPIPNWMDKDNKSERVSEEELAELEKEFEIFN
jgi:DnaD/phage-associated family protein